MSDPIGEFECKLDPKGRIVLPAGLLRQLSDEDKSRFVVCRGIERHLVLYTDPEWQRLVGFLKSKLNDFNIRQRQFAQRFLGGSHELLPDGQNRLLLPKRLLTYARIDDTLILSARPTAQGNKIEIWEPSLYDRLFEGDEREFAELAEEMLGGNKLVIPLDQD